MLFLLNFFDETESTQNPWLMWVIMGVLIVGLIVFSSINNKKARKRNEERNSMLEVGVQVTTIGGIVGTIIKLDDQFLWIETGVAPNTMTMQILRQAIHSIGVPQTTATKSETTQAVEAGAEDEIK